MHLSAFVQSPCVRYKFWSFSGEQRVFLPMTESGMCTGMANMAAAPVLANKLDNDTGNGKDLEIVYEGTIQGERGDVGSPVREFYRLPLKHKNEITVSVQASSDAEVVLYDKEPSFNSSNVEVEIVLGSARNSRVTVGLKAEDGDGDGDTRRGKCQYPKESVVIKSILSATHLKVFTIRWHYGRVMVYNHGLKKPFIVWDGPKHAAFTHLRVRTPSCSGEWQVQNAPPFTTAASKEYTDILINSGRLDFEVNGWHDAWIHFFAEPKFVTNPSLTVILGWYYAPYQISGFWVNVHTGSKETRTDKPALVHGSYRRFFVEWDAMNMVLGHGDGGIGHDTPFAWRRNLETNVKPIKYFALQYDKVQSSCYFHILNRVLEEDTEPRKRLEHEPVITEVKFLPAPSSS